MSAAAKNDSFLLRLAFGTDKKSQMNQAPAPRAERTVQLPPATPEQRQPRMLGSLRSDSAASCASTVLFAGEELQSPRTPSKGLCGASARPTDLSEMLEEEPLASSCQSAASELDATQTAHRLQLLFERYSGHGRDREPMPEYSIALRAFGPPRCGAAVHTLQEDIQNYTSRLGAASRKPPFIFSEFASPVRKRPSVEPRLDGVRFAKLCRECGLLDERVLDENAMATSLTTAQADICFRKVLPKGQRSLGFELFCTGLLPELARKKATSAEALVQRLVDASPPPLASPRSPRSMRPPVDMATPLVRPASAPLR